MLAGAKISTGCFTLTIQEVHARAAAGDRLNGSGIRHRVFISHWNNILMKDRFFNFV